MPMPRRLLLILLLLCGATPVAAQLGSVPFTFTGGTTISSSQVNTNFSTIYSNALNRTGGTMTGSLTARDILAASGSTYDIGATGTKFKDAYLSGTLTVATISCTTCLAETGIADGSLLARVAGTETISGVWTFTALPLISTAAPALRLVETDQAADAKSWAVGQTAGVFYIATLDDAGAFQSLHLTIGRATGNLLTVGTISERNRAFAMGATQARAYNAGDFTDTGAGSWGVDSGDLVNFKYRVVGDTLFLSIDTNETSITGTVTELIVAIPGSFTAQETHVVPALIRDNSTTEVIGLAQVTSSGTTVVITKVDGSAFTGSTNATGFNFEIAFKVS